MVKILGLFFLIGASLAIELEDPAVEALLKVVSENKEYLEVCEETLGSRFGNFQSCAALVEDVVSLKSLALNITEEALTFYTEAKALYALYEKCSTESIFKEIACYESLVTSAKADAAAAEADAETAAEEVETLVAQVKSDIASCLSKAKSAKLLEAKIRLCKHKLSLKN